MRARLRPAVAAALLLAPVSGVVPAAADRVDRADTVLVVPANGSTVTTPFVTSPGAWYVVEVSGTFAYDRYGNLADCGSHDVDHGVVGQSWVAGGGIGLTVDGIAADCAHYPSSYRTYVLSVTGTGAPLAFAIADATGHADNAGSLQVAVVTTVDAAGTCHHAFVPIPDTSYGDLVVTAAAWHSGADVLWWLEVDCRVYVSGTLRTVVNTQLLAPLVAAADYVSWVELGRVRRCLTVRVLVEPWWPVMERTYPCVT